MVNPGQWNEGLVINSPTLFHTPVRTVQYRLFKHLSFTLTQSSWIRYKPCSMSYFLLISAEYAVVALGQDCIKTTTQH